MHSKASGESHLSTQPRAEEHNTAILGIAGSYVHFQKGAGGGELCCRSHEFANVVALRTGGGGGAEEG